MKKIMGILALVLAIGMVGCGSSGISNQVESATAEDFLMNFFTVENTEEYDILMAATEKGDDAEIVQNATEEYFEPYEKYFSEDGFVPFEANRYPVALQSMAKEKSYTFQADSVQLTVAEDGKAMDFQVSVSVREKDGASNCSVTQKGQILLNEDDKIESVWFYNFGDLYDPKLSPGVS